MAAPVETQGVIRSMIPARIDRLPWTPFHTRMVVALGVAWILDGLEITVASSVADTLSQPETLGLSSAAVGFIASFYLAFVCAKVTLAMVVNRSRSFLQGPLYIGVMKALGIVLMVFAMKLFWEGAQLLQEYWT